MYVASGGGIFTDKRQGGGYGRLAALGAGGKGAECASCDKATAASSSGPELVTELHVSAERPGAGAASAAPAAAGPRDSHPDIDPGHRGGAGAAWAWAPLSSAAEIKRN